MRIQYVEHYEELSEYAANLMIETIVQNPHANICLASGTSPELAYELFVKKVLENQIDIRNIKFTKLDEWCGFHHLHESTCEVYIQEKILKPLKIRKENVITFQPDAEDFQKEAERVKKELTSSPIDLCILGLGKNGHLGLNEPNEKLQPFVHVTELTDITKTHGLLKNNHVTHGMTIGMCEIVNSKQILFLVTGDGKQAVFEEFMKQEISTFLPASFLWMHEHTETVIQKDCFKI